ncbi:MAG TPA: SDR family NAD(P)-dependent oxidoreductase [Woeseiaceae bacterium]|nr:SDR family NAD(P)-dependent oxidoreductase [Woeseiaceae bacterium]
MIDFTGKVALVTGGSRGIGAATVKAIAAAGGSVVIHYGSNKEAAMRVANEVGDENCHTVKCDLSVLAAANALWDDALAWKSRIDVVVNNAGIYCAENRAGPEADWHKVWQRTLQVNLMATADLCRAAINHWRNRKSGGAIVNVASRAAFRGDSPDHWSYAASKGGIISLTKTLARAYSSAGIYTYAVAPGFVLTDMVLEEFERDPGARARVVSEIPYGDMAPASDVANAICFLASGLATHATGQTIDINGASYVR